MTLDLAEIRRRIAVEKAGGAALDAYRAEQARKAHAARLQAEIARLEREQACAQSLARTRAEIGDDPDASARAHREAFLRHGKRTQLGGVGHGTRLPARKSG